MGRALRSRDSKRNATVFRPYTGDLTTGIQGRAWQLFLKTVYQKLRRDLPEGAKVPGIGVVSRYAGNAWGVASPETKEIFRRLAENRAVLEQLLRQHDLGHAQANRIGRRRVQPEQSNAVHVSERKSVDVESEDSPSPAPGPIPVYAEGAEEHEADTGSTSLHHTASQDHLWEAFLRSPTEPVHRGPGVEENIPSDFPQGEWHSPERPSVTLDTSVEHSLASEDSFLFQGGNFQESSPTENWPWDILMDGQSTEPNV